MEKTILIVDDDAEVRNLLQIFLAEKGLKVHALSDGWEALGYIKTRIPDLILLDVMMPNLDGYGFLKELRKEPRWRGIPVVVLTGREMMRDVFLQEGVCDFIVKPCAPEDLFKRIHALLS